MCSRGVAVILQVSYIGMKPVEISARPGQEVLIAMEESATQLDEVIVTGYGNFKKSTYTGSATVVSIDELQNIPAVSVAQLLESQVPGLTISAASGQPGSHQRIRIRGAGSINASNEPLFVLDGIHYYVRRYFK